MLQGKFLKPNFLFEFENVLMNPLSIAVGEIKSIFDHKFFIYGCNPNTRSVCEYNGITQQPDVTQDIDDKHKTWKAEKEYVPSNLKEDKD